MGAKGNALTLQPFAYCTEVACSNAAERRRRFCGSKRWSGPGHRQCHGVAMRKLKLNSWWKIAAAGVASILWLLGLVDQLDSPQMTAGYLALSAAIVAIAVA
jgi:hypothetical protein